MKLARYTTSWHDSGEIRYAAGRHYPLTDETQAHIAQGIAELVEADVDPKRAEELVAKAQEAADKAAMSAAQAKADLEAANTAAQLARDAAEAIATAVDTATEPAPVSYPGLQIKAKK